MLEKALAAHRLRRREKGLSIHHLDIARNPLDNPRLIGYILRTLAFTRSQALHSLTAWGLNPVSTSLTTSGILIAVYGSMGMLLIGSSMHIVPELGATSLATEKNATLMSFVWTLAVIVMFVGANKPEIAGVLLCR